VLNCHIVREVKNSNIMTQAEKLISRYSPALFFVLLVLLKIEVIFWPPVWDEAFSIFPAGFFLAQNDFSILKLLRETGYFHGGPNVHSLTWGTLFVAIGYRLTTDLNTLFLSIHLLQLFVASIGLSVWFRIFKSFFSWPIALAVTLLILFYPLFSVQAGRMYLEIYLFTATAFVFYYLHQQRYVAVLVSFACAFFAKVSAVVLLPMIILSILLNKTLSRLARMTWGLVTIGIGATLYFAVSALRSLSVAHPLVRDENTLSSCMSLFLSYYFSAVPDLMFLAFSAPICFFVLLSAFRRQEILEMHMRLFLSAILLFASVVLIFLFLLPLLQRDECAVLPRYFLIVLPPLLLLLVAALKTLLREAELRLFLAVALLYLIVNQGGRLYPKLHQQSIAIAERSNEYLDISKVQRKAFAELEKLPQDVPLFHSLPDIYYARYPVGYVSKPLKQGISVSTTAPYASHDLSVFPDHFFAYVEYPDLGGRALLKLIETAEAMPNYEVRMLRLIKFSSAKARIYSVKRKKVQG
jgi:hypothetical protein